MLPCGSQSMRSTRSPPAAAMAPTLHVMLVLPTPPLPLAMATTRGDVMLWTIWRIPVRAGLRHTMRAVLRRTGVALVRPIVCTRLHVVLQPTVYVCVHVGLHTCLHTTLQEEDAGECEGAQRPSPAASGDPVGGRRWWLTLLVVGDVGGGLLDGGEGVAPCGEGLEVVAGECVGVAPVVSSGVGLDADEQGHEGEVGGSAGGVGLAEVGVQVVAAGVPAVAGLLGDAEQVAGECGLLGVDLLVEGGDCSGDHADRKSKSLNSCYVIYTVVGLR